MEIKLDLELKQVINILKQLSESDWEKLKAEIEKEKKESKLPEQSNSGKRKFGSMKGLVVYMADDFDAPLEDFKEYME
jgi:hypothetical protein